MRNLMPRLNDIFDQTTYGSIDSFGSLFNNNVWNTVFGNSAQKSQPRIINDGNTRHYEFDVPGATHKTLKADLDHDVLTISYTTKAKYATHSGRYTYTLPADVDLQDEPLVSLQDGVLTITVATFDPAAVDPPARRSLKIT